MTDHLIFGISGRAQSGKTTLAEHIQHELSFYGNYDTLIPVVELNFALYLKNMLQDLFNIPKELLYDDKGKNKYTYIKWEDCPPVKGVQHQIGCMTGRELMEYIGAFVRQLNPAGWLNALTATIKKTQERTIFLIPDVRAPNEVEAIQKMGGKVLRLALNPLNRDTEIENLLDRDRYDWSNFDAIIHNTDMPLSDKNELGLQQFLRFFQHELNLEFCSDKL